MDEAAKIGAHQQQHQQQQQQWLMARAQHMIEHFGRRPSPPRPAACGGGGGGDVSGATGAAGAAGSAGAAAKAPMSAKSVKKTPLRLAQCLRFLRVALAASKPRAATSGGSVNGDYDSDPQGGRQQQQQHADAEAVRAATHSSLLAYTVPVLAWSLQLEALQRTLRPATVETTAVRASTI